MSRSSSSSIVVALGQQIPIQALNGEESVVPFGSVPISGADPRGVMVVIHIESTDGRAVVAAGLRWPGEEPVWAERDERLRERAMALPILPDDVGEDAQVEILFRVRPSLPSRAASARGSAWVHLPGSLS